jgi:phage shock protein A
MFEDLRNAFREAVQNFKDELDRDSVPENVDRLLGGMIDEVTQARARLKGIEADLEDTRRRVTLEEEHVATNRRRERMARDIGDEETARLALEYSERHQKRLVVFRQKAAALEEEVTLLGVEVEEMMVKVQEARERRASLQAEAGRTGARDSLSEADDLFDAFDRMGERIAGDEADAEAAEGFAREFDDLRVDPHAPPRRPEVDVDARLQELKRRMGRD